MRKLKQLLMNLWNDESGQGATEYILLLVVVVAVVLMFKGKIMSFLSAKLDYLNGQMNSVTSDPTQ